MAEEPRLYGIFNSNRFGDNLWGKNQFNSTFPVSLACYMRDHKINPVYLVLDEELHIKATYTTSFNEIFNTTLSNEEIFFDFEGKYDPYQIYSHDDIQGIDLVVKSIQGEYLRPLEIKLTVIPDNSTRLYEEADWGTEIVIRPATTKYCALGIADSCRDSFKDIREFFEPVCHGIQHWDSVYEIYAKMANIVSAIDTFQKSFYKRQKPLLMQPIWKTLGVSPMLADNSFDMFIWSDFAFSRLFLDSALKCREDDITRPARSTARFARFMYEVSSSGKSKINAIYTEMAFNKQTDKEFAVNGCVTRKYMNSERKTKPVLHKSVIKELILGGGEKKLSPERRFDQTIYFTFFD